MEELNNEKNTQKVVSGVAIASFVLGIASFILGTTIVFGIVCGVISIILGIIALVKKNKPVFPVIGMILSVVGIIISTLIIVIIFILGCNMDFSKNNITQAINEIKTTLNETNDVISGNSWEEADGSYLVFEKNGDYRYYQSKNNLSDNYFEGTYKVYTGEKAVKYIAEDLSEYGVTEQEQRDLFDRNEEYSVDNYYCIVLTTEKCIINGENELEETKLVPYFGFYYEDIKKLDIANMNTGNYYDFTKVEK